MTHSTKERNQVIELLLSLNLSPLPVAPKQDCFKYPEKDDKGNIKYQKDDFTPKPLFTGKNPSYLDANGIPHTIYFSKYQNTLPTESELALWFCNPLTGIGTLGNDSFTWIDLDSNKFANQKECDQAYQNLLENNLHLNAAWLEKTQSGGYRIGVRLATPKDFTNFKLSASGDHVGEALGKGRFTVLAPTVGVSGKAYQNINRPRVLPVIESLESIGIFSIASKPVLIPSTPIKFDIPTSSEYISLLDCITKENRDILEGKNSDSEDRSYLFNKAVKDLLGWANWLNAHNLNYSQNPQDIIRQAGSNMGFHDKRIGYILKSINTESCQPAAKFAGGDEACIRKINKLLGYETQEDRQKIFDDINWKNWIKSKVFKAIREVHQDQFEFPADMPQHNAIIAVKSGLGTGKTEALLKIIAETLLGSLIVGYRNNLLFQTISRGGEKFITISHINQDGVVVDKEEISMSCCINSLYKLDGMFKGRTIFFDETISVLLHTIEGGTFRSSEQKRAMNLIEMAVKDADRVFLLDGNLTSAAVEFIHSFAPEKQLYTIENTKKIKPHNIIFVDGGEVTEEGEFKLKPTKKSHLIQHLSEKDVVPFIATDSKTHAHNLQDYLIKAGKCGITISADTVQESYAREFLENPDLYIRKHKPQFVIITPSCESGVSITEKYFTAKYSFFCGVLGTSSQHQMMFRLRDNTIPHFVYCPESSMIRDNAIPMGYTGEAIKKALLERINLSSLMAIDVSSFAQAKDIIIRSLEEMQNDKWFDYSCKIWALANFERQNLRKCLVHSLIEAGHNVGFEQWGISEEIEDTFKEIKAEQLEKEAELQYLAVPFESMEECKKFEGQDVNLETRRKILKTKLLLETLPGIDKEECYGVELFKRKLETRDYISKHQNYARLVNFEYIQRKHEENWYFGASAGKYKYMGSLLKTYQETRLAVLHELNILEFVKPGKEFTKESPDLVELFEEVNNSKDLLTKLNIKKRSVTESGKEVLEIFRLLIGFIGLELGKPVRKLDDKGTRLNHYQIDWDAFNDPIRQAIVKITTAKDMDWLETHQVIQWITPDDMASKDLAEKYRMAISSEDYSIYSQARLNIESSKFVEGHHGLTTEQGDHNKKMDQIVAQAWEQLDPQEQKALLDLRPADTDFMNVIDQKVQTDNNYTDEYMSYQQSRNSLNLWKLRLKAGLEIGKQFVIKLVQDFFATVPMSVDAGYMDLYNLYESHYN
ncbi:plasmid replication protein, CyRepA1 family [Anabaena sp. UHCC 0204]|uniref:plasmid replication protein, CyRepA1 family n=1 Tax=Anabaena sp. UHCC 0204 TaxID=2590009 RepID=UPI0014464F04|nr:plasmid replication protein, CyRepA1 family [Anabaena sp. UHCC 0204]MTJ10739.1 hypothetical protein [Anabaena sp. UHCC 0204]